MKPIGWVTNDERPHGGRSSYSLIITCQLYNPLMLRRMIE